MVRRNLTVWVCGAVLLLSCERRIPGSECLARLDTAAQVFYVRLDSLAVAVEAARPGYDSLLAVAMHLTDSVARLQAVVRPQPVPLRLPALGMEGLPATDGPLPAVPTPQKTLDTLRRPATDTLALLRRADSLDSPKLTGLEQ